jgi:hypothetical protein
MIGQAAREPLDSPVVRKCSRRRQEKNDDDPRFFSSIRQTQSTRRYDKLNFKFIRYIAPVAGISRGASVMVFNPLMPVKTVPEFWSAGVDRVWPVSQDDMV